MRVLSGSRPPAARQRLIVKCSRVRATASESPIVGPSESRHVPEWHSLPAVEIAETLIRVHAD
jgi:hypothetical protein